jgi:hypothetical protein
VGSGKWEAGSGKREAGSGKRGERWINENEVMRRGRRIKEERKGREK